MLTLSVPPGSLGFIVSDLDVRALPSSKPQPQPPLGMIVSDLDRGGFGFSQAELAEFQGGEGALDAVGTALKWGAIVIALVIGWQVVKVITS